VIIVFYFFALLSWEDVDLPGISSGMAEQLYNHHTIHFHHPYEHVHQNSHQFAQ